MSAVLECFPLDLVDDHPDNPRLVFRKDVIAAIAANLKGRYSPKHAIHERPVGGRFQRLAARQAGEVLLVCKKLLPQVNSFLDKAKNLAAVHKPPREKWPVFVQGIPASVLRNHAIFAETLPEMIDLPAHHQERG